MIVGLCMAGLMLIVSDYVSKNQFGLLHTIDMPVWLKVIIGILLMDCTGAYLVHIVEHKIQWM